jgi:hypothetical protein
MTWWKDGWYSLMNWRIPKSCHIGCAVLELISDLLHMDDSSMDKDISPPRRVRNGDVDLGPFQVALATSKAQSSARKILRDDEVFRKSRLTYAS